MAKKITPAALAKRIYLKRKAFFEKLPEHIEEVKLRAKALLPDSLIYLFGSVYRGDYSVALSDVDIAVVSGALPESPDERAKLKIEILRELHGSPIELHLLTPQEWEFYRAFIRDDYREV